LPADLTAARRCIEKWRSKSNGQRRPLPQKIWDVAADLVPAHGVYRVSRVLRLEYYKVKKQAETRQAGRRKASTRPSSRRAKPVPKPTRPAFVEVSAPPPVMSSSLGYTVELTDESGRQMTIRSSTGMDAAALIAAFCGEAS
jgi:hypothetical protein